MHRHKEIVDFSTMSRVTQERLFKAYSVSVWDKDIEIVMLAAHCICIHVTDFHTAKSLIR